VVRLHPRSGDGRDGDSHPVTHGATRELLYTPRADGLGEAFAHQVTMRTWKVYEQQSADFSGGVSDLRPFSFISVLPALSGAEALGLVGAVIAVPVAGMAQVITQRVIAPAIRRATTAEEPALAGVPVPPDHSPADNDTAH